MAKKPKQEPAPERKSLVDLLASDISQKIGSGVLRTGDKLPSVTELAGHYAVSASVVREAISKLSAFGMLEVHHGKPTRVSSPTAQPFTGVLNAAVISSEQGFRDAIELRFAIEPMIAYKAASRASLADLKKVESALNAMEKAANTIKPWVNADLQFHSALAEACGNKLLFHLFEGIKSIVYETMYIRRVARKPDTEGALRRHRELLELIMARDEDGAREAMERHSQVSQEVLDRMAKAKTPPRSGDIEWSFGSTDSM